MPCVTEEVIEDDAPDTASLKRGLCKDLFFELHEAIALRSTGRIADNASTTHATKFPEHSNEVGLDSGAREIRDKDGAPPDRRIVDCAVRGLFKVAPVVRLFRERGLWSAWNLRVFARRSARRRSATAARSIAADVPSLRCSGTGALIVEVGPHIGQKRPDLRLVVVNEPSVQQRLSQPWHQLSCLLNNLDSNWHRAMRHGFRQLRSLRGPVI